MYKQKEINCFKLSSIILIIIIFSFIIITPHHGPYAQEFYQYPTKPGTQEWSYLKTHNEMVKACQIPENLLNKMSTNELIRACFDYPLLGDLVLYNNIQQGFDNLLRNSNAFQELFRRNDAAPLLLKKYINLDTVINFESDSDYNKGKHAVHLVLLEIIISQTKIMEAFKVTDIITLCDEGINKYNSKIKNANIYGFLSKTASSYMISKAMNQILNKQLPMSELRRINSTEEIERIRKKYLTDETIKKFMNTSIVLDKRVITEIPYDAGALLMRKVKG